MLERNMSMLWVKLLDARQKIGLCRHEQEMFDVMSDKFRGCEKSWEWFKGRIVEMKMISANLPLSPLALLNQSRKLQAALLANIV